jgi:thiamine-phosphate diphosphorylase
MRRAPITVRGVYAILDLPHSSTLAPEAIVAALALGGAGLIQLRAKHADAAQRRAWATVAGEACVAAGVGLIINDDLDLAMSGLPGVVGVHLGQHDLSSLGPDLARQRRRRAELRANDIALGVSTHSLAQVHRTIEDLTPDYLGFGPVFPTATKLDADPVVGLADLARACLECPIPIVAIGGIDVARAAELRATGVAAIAAIGALNGTTPTQIQHRTAALARAFSG